MIVSGENVVKNFFKQKENYGLYAMVVLALILCVLLIYDAINCRNQNMYLYASNMEKQAQEYLYMSKLSGEDVNEELVRVIGDNFDTSASVYAIAAADDDIFFVKDSYTTSQLSDISFNTYVDAGNAQYLPSPAAASFVTKLDGKKYIISMAATSNNGGTTLLAIASRWDYVEKQGKYNLLIQHVCLYALLFAAASITLVFFQNVKLRNQLKQINSLKDTMAKERVTLDELVSEISAGQNRNMNEKNSGFLSRKTMMSILDSMTKEQLKKSCTITIKVTGEEEQIKTVVLLERINKKGCISCLLESNTFLMLLINNELEDARRMKGQLAHCYEQEYQEKCPDWSMEIRQL
jgi:hypothetical protein